MLNVDQLLNKELLIDLLENYPSSIVVFNSERRIVYLNKVVLSITGRKLDDFVGHLDEELFPPDGTDQYLPTLKQVQETGKPAMIEATLRLGTKTSINKVNYVPIKDEQGKLSYIMSYIFDIAEQRENEKSLRNSREEIKAITDNSPDVIARLDREMRHLFINPYGEQVYGKKREEIIGKSSAELGMPPDLVT